jgi:hypothetical protein
VAAPHSPSPAARELHDHRRSTMKWREERSDGKNENALGFEGRAAGFGFCYPDCRVWPLDQGQGRSHVHQSTGPKLAQAGADFPGPGLGCGLGAGSAGARATGPNGPAQERGWATAMRV